MSQSRSLSMPSARLFLHRLEERCTPSATFDYFAPTKTLTVTATSNGFLSVTEPDASPSGYVRVTSGSSVFDSNEADQKVRSLVLKFNTVNNAIAWISPDIYLTGNLTVYGARQQQSLTSGAQFGGTINYLAHANATDDVVFTKTTQAGWNTLINLRGGSNELELQGDFGGKLTVYGGKQDDTVDLAKNGNLDIGLSVTFNLSGGTNMLRGAGGWGVTTYQDWSYVGGPGVDKVDFSTHGTRLQVFEDVTFSLGNSTSNLNNLVDLDVGLLEGDVTFTGGGQSINVVRFRTGMIVGGDLTANLKGDLNRLYLFGSGVDGLEIQGNLVYNGGPSMDNVRINGTKIWGDAAIDLDECPNNSQSVDIGHGSGSVTVLGSLSIMTGIDDDDISLRRLTVGNELNITTFAGDDTVELNDVEVTGPTLIELRTGNDTLNIETIASDSWGSLNNATTFHDTVTIRGGVGNDTVNLSDDGNVFSWINFMALVALNGEDGSDTLENAGNLFGVTGNFENFELGDTVP